MNTRVAVLLLGGIALVLAGCGQQPAKIADSLPGGPSVLVAGTDTDSDFVFGIDPNNLVIRQGEYTSFTLTIQTLGGYTGVSPVALSLAASSETHPLPEGLSVSPNTIQMVEGQTKSFKVVLNISRDTEAVTGRYVNLVATAADGRAESVYLVLDVLPKGFVQVDTFMEHTCALDVDGKAYCWGEGSDGQLGNGEYRSSNTPVAVKVSEGVTFNRISTGAYHTCALSQKDGPNNLTKTYCWGMGAGGRLGNGSENWSAVPVEVSVPGEAGYFEAIDASAFVTCAISNNGKAYCWGDGQFGQLGNDSTGMAYTPTQVSQNIANPHQRVYQISVGYTHVCATTTESFASSLPQTWCWGEGNRGQLGNDTYQSTPFVSSPQPVSIPSGTHPMASVISAGTEDRTHLV